MKTGQHIFTLCFNSLAGKRQHSRQYCLAICADLFTCQICCRMQPTRFIKGKQRQSTLYRSLQCLCLCSTLYLSVRFPHATACTAVSSANSFPALGLAEPSICLALALPFQSHLNDYTSSYLRWCSPGNPRTACRQPEDRGLNLCLITDACVCDPILSFHFLVALYAVTYRRRETPAHRLFRLDTPERG